MADWPMFDCDFGDYGYYPCNQEQNAQAQYVHSNNCPSPTLNLFLPNPSQAPQQPQGDNPRVLRNKAEKQRRDNLNHSVARLASIVPAVVHSGRKLNKISVLRHAAHYLRSHHHVFGKSTNNPRDFSANFADTFLRSINGCLITTTYKGIIVVVSPNIQEYLGYTEFGLLGQNIFEIVHKDDHQLLRDKLHPKSCSLTPRGQLIIPYEEGANKRVAEELANEKHNFIIRFKKCSKQKKESPQYVTCHVDGSFRKSDRAGTIFDHSLHNGRRRARSRGTNPFACGNDIVFVCVVRPNTDTFVMENMLESFKMEYRTRHSIDGEIIQCEQRIALVTGYMTNEVRGVNAMNFMHRDDVRWVAIALREMYECHRTVGESYYRLMTKNGTFIYMRSHGFLEVDKNTNAVTSFVCTNTMITEQEGKHLIKLMKKKFTLMIHNTEEFNEEETVENEKEPPPVEDPIKLERVILHLVTDLPSPKPEGDEGVTSQDKEELPSSHLSIIPPNPEQIHKAITKSYSVLRSCYMQNINNRKGDQVDRLSTNQNIMDAKPEQSNIETTNTENSFFANQPSTSGNNIITNTENSFFANQPSTSGNNIITNTENSFFANQPSTSGNNIITNTENSFFANQPSTSGNNIITNTANSEDDNSSAESLPQHENNMPYDALSCDENLNFDVDVPIDNTFNPPPLNVSDVPCSSLQCPNQDDDTPQTFPNSFSNESQNLPPLDDMNLNLDYNTSTAAGANDSNNGCDSECGTSSNYTAPNMPETANDQNQQNHRNSDSSFTDSEESEYDENYAIRNSLRCHGPLMRLTTTVETVTYQTKPKTSKSNEGESASTMTVVYTTKRIFFIPQCCNGTTHDLPRNEFHFGNRSDENNEIEETLALEEPRNAELGEPSGLNLPSGSGTVKTKKDENNEVKTEKDENNEVNTKKDENNEVKTEKDENNEVKTEKDENNEVNAENNPLYAEAMQAIDRQYMEDDNDERLDDDYDDDRYDRFDPYYYIDELADDEEFNNIN